MSEQYTKEPMLDMFIFETSQLIEQLEQSILNSEKESSFSESSINEIFRIMHTIKGSSAMMMFQNIATLAHTIEDVFYFLREEKPQKVNCSSLSDLVLEGIDFIKIEIEKIKNGDSVDGDATDLMNELKLFLSKLQSENNSNTVNELHNKAELKQQYYIRQEKVTPATYQYSYKAIIHFEDGCEMENIRAYTIIHNLHDITNTYYHIPEEIIENDDSIELIREHGFQIYFNADSTYEEMNDFFQQTIFLKDLTLIKLEDDKEIMSLLNQKELTEQEIRLEISNSIQKPKTTINSEKSSHTSQSMISVSVSKLDKLMDLVGEMVISEAMVVQNPDLLGLELNRFQKAARQLNKITSELQDIVMSIRMVPLSTTFQKMNRIIRDMCKQLNKEVRLEILGEETEVDKNIIEHISDPLMHLVRNALDHGIESLEDRLNKGKSQIGTISLEARNSGSDVLVIVKDDGKGLDKEKILKKALENDLLYKKQEEMTDKEIFHLILLPGFSTKDCVSEYSGRGVGMDVVCKNIESIGGTLTVDSVPDQGTTMTLKIPLTLAIIDGMNIKVGDSCYTIPTVSIKESLRPRYNDIITDPDGNEMIMVRGQCYPILRLHKKFKVDTKVTDFTEGIIIITENDDKTSCIFADELLGQQQVVVKNLPSYIQKMKKIKGLAGCTLLGDGSISLILDIAELFI